MVGSTWRVGSRRVHARQTPGWAIGASTGDSGDRCAAGRDSSAGVVRVSTFQARPAHLTGLVAVANDDARDAREAAGCLSADVCADPSGQGIVLVISRGSRSPRFALSGPGTSKWRTTRSHRTRGPNRVRCTIPRHRFSSVNKDFVAERREARWPPETVRWTTVYAWAGRRIARRPSASIAARWSRIGPPTRHRGAARIAGAEGGARRVGPRLGVDAAPRVGGQLSRIAGRWRGRGWRWRVSGVCRRDGSRDAGDASGGACGVADALPRQPERPGAGEQAVLRRPDGGIRSIVLRAQGSVPPGQPGAVRQCPRQDSNLRHTV